MTRVLILLAVAMAVLLPGAPPGPAWASNATAPDLPRVEGFRLRATPRLSLKAMYDDNVDMNGITDEELSAKPGLKIEGWDDKTRVEASGDILLKDYVDNDDLDRLDYFWNAKAERKLNEKWDVRLVADQKRDHMVDSVSEDFAFDVEPTVRTITTLTPSAGWAVNERLQANAAYTWVKANYDKAQYSDFTTHMGDMDLSYALTERTSLLARGVGQYTDFKREDPYMKGEQVAGQGFLGVSRQLTEDIKATVMGGAGVYNTRYQVSGAPDEDSTEVSWLADVAVVYSPQKWEFTAAFRRSVTPSFYGESVTRDQVKLYARYKATERLDLNLANTYTLSGTSGLLSSKRKSEGLFIQPTANYLLMEDLTLQVGGNYNYNKNQIDNVTKNRFRAWTQLTWSMPMYLN